MRCTVQWIRGSVWCTSRELEVRDALRLAGRIARRGGSRALFVHNDRRRDSLVAVVYPEQTAMRRDTDGARYNAGTIRRFARLSWFAGSKGAYLAELRRVVK